MATKHYDIDYLQKSRRLLVDLKEQSYTLFSELEHGTIIDLGCGAGKDVIEMAKVVSEQVKIIGVDHDPEMLQQGKNDSKGMGNVDFVLSEAYPLPFDDNSISGVRSERLIQHLKNPENVIKEIRRILKKDHPLVIVETDWHSLSFYTEFVDVQKKVNMYLTDTKINNGFAARRLLSYLQLGGFRDIKFEIHPFVIDSLEDANEYFWIEKIITETSEKGYIENKEHKDFYDALQKANDAHCFACSINLVLASCIK